MNVLWISLVEFPPLSRFLNRAEAVTCGWLYSSAKSLLEQTKDLQLGVAVYSYGKTYEEYEVEGIRYYMIPCSSMSAIDRKQIQACCLAIDSFQPDIIHIHGTEHSLALAACIANAGRAKIVATIQGLAGPYARYADGGLSLGDKLWNITPLDCYRGTSLLNAKRQMNRRAKCENQVLSQLTDIIGRTQWDYAHVMAVNPNLHYHFLNETLRDSFYEGKRWSLETCTQHSIFVSNSNSPLKGAHQVLKALPIILRSYPNTIVNFCGRDVMKNDWHSLIRFQGYHLYLRRLVKKLRLEHHVRFLGTLSEQEMKQAFLSAHVYVMPSAIENSPNSLCEAQMLGVPTVASYCGGVPSLLTDEKTGYFYRYEEFEMLAQIIINLFKEKNFDELSVNEQKIAFIRHDRKVNSGQLENIYNKIKVR